MRQYSYSLKQGSAVRQRMFELSFQVTTLRAYLYKSQGLAGEKPLGHVAFDNFSLLLLLTQHDMKVDVCLGSVPFRLIECSHLHKPFSSLFMEVAEPGFESVQLFSSADGSVGKDLLRVDYTRVQSTSPNYEGYDQIISVDVSTVIFRVAPEPLLTFYDLLMTTFVPSSPSPGEAPVVTQDSLAVGRPTPELSSRTGRLRLLVKLASVECGVFVHFMGGDRANSSWQLLFPMREPVSQRCLYRLQTRQFYSAIQ